MAENGKSEDTFGNPKQNEIMRDRNKLDRENRALKAELNASSVKFFEYRHFVKAILFLLIFVPILVYVLWFR